MFNNIYNNIMIIKLKLLGAKIGKNVKSYGKFTVYNPQNLTIGHQSTINDYVILIAGIKLL